LKVIQINALKAIQASRELNDKALVTQNVLITREHWHNLQSYFSDGNLLPASRQ